MQEITIDQMEIVSGGAPAAAIIAAYVAGGVTGAGLVLGTAYLVYMALK